MLGDWEAAAKDLHVASKLDYDEEIMAVLKKVIFIDKTSKFLGVFFMIFNLSSVDM